MSSIKVIFRDLLHCTKLLVMRCWYFSFTLGSVISDITVWSLTTILQLPGHSIIWLAPSSIILVVRYSVQQEVQYRWPHSRPRIFWMFKAIRAITGVTEYLSSWLWAEIDSRFHNPLLASRSSS